MLFLVCCIYIQVHFRLEFFFMEANNMNPAQTAPKGKIFKLHVVKVPDLSYFLFTSIQLFGPQCEKTCLRGMRSTKVQTSLHIQAVCSAPLLFT